MKNRTKRWLRLARNWGIFLGGVLTVWLIVKIARPNVNYALKDKYFHTRKNPRLGETTYTEYIEDICDPDTQISTYLVSDLMEGKIDGITYTDGLYVLNDRYYIQGEDFDVLLHETDIDGYGTVTMVPGAADALEALLCAAEAENGERFILGDSYIAGAVEAKDVGNDCYLLAYYDTSEHITGMSVDLLIEGADFRTYMTAPLAVWLQDNAWRFGFAVRYPFWEGEWTGVFFQPWHIKYVGQPHAAYLYTNRLSLEEYLTKFFADKRYYLTDYTGEDGVTRTYVTYRQNAYDKTIYIPDTLSQAEVSFDNMLRCYYVTGILEK